MNINVNCGCGCGCHGGTQSTQEWLDLSQEPGFQPFPDEPFILPEEEMTSLCDAANQWADGVKETMQRMKSFFSGVSVTATSVTSFIATILKIESFKAVLAPALFFQVMVAAISLAVTTAVTDEANDAAEEYEGAFKCAIYFASTPQDAKSRVLAVVSQIRQNYGVLVSGLFYALVQITDWRKVTVENDGLILPEYVGQGDCSGCAQSEFALISLSDFDDTAGNQPTSIVGGTTYENGYVRMTTAAASGSAQPAINISRADLETLLGVEVTTMHVDYISFDINKSTVNGNDYDKEVTLSLMESGGLTEHWNINANDIPATQPDYEHIEIFPDVDIAFPSGDSTTWFVLTLEKTGNLGGVHVDNLEIRGTIA